MNRVGKSYTGARGSMAKNRSKEYTFIKILSSIIKEAGSKMKRAEKENSHSIMVSILACGKITLGTDREDSKKMKKGQR
jgi:hypothetical protein